MKQTPAQTPAQTQTFSPAEISAATEYLKLRDRVIHPAGRFDNGGRWYPSEPCTCRVRPPSRAYPYSLLVHCRTAAHVAEQHGVSRVAVLRAAKQIEAQA